MARRPRIDTSASAVSIMAKSLKPIEPPAHIALTKEDMPFFHSIIEEFARSEWTAHQLELAAMLARDMADMNSAQLDLRSTGEIVTTMKGNAAVNPLRTVVQTLSGSILAKRRSLALHARAAGDTTEVAKRRSVAKGVEADNPMARDSGGLIARPN